ncbi:MULTISPECIES: PaaX family transcriptional regulator [Streptomyces]|uniref:PaaX family transcriptional regulator n=1 Tax=Streptomyces ureilyticus TaxID=1775131 RepID=A0ABX0E1I3_9ACTN|nr:PaaX family transcriptional regulator C-terminal domain-containing protein [Streptomyces ureilyticus]NGO45151.1 PaaX family transcriptional regulator [Streptomyces ureilyticus]WSZ21022.1 PaaX family transcriptional regulator [Streptomyces canus]WSZ37013.1 PaaX family transcriptional regulator [Streptomyces sp. NBC_00882]WSZ64282.1 PaaX family transcriptional regulator [Streptomyces canus]
MSDLLDDDPTQAAPPRSLIVTVYGLYAREVGGWIGVSTLIRLLAELGVDAQAVRSSIHRLKRREILVSERRDGRAGYALSPYARSVLETGDRRIFERHTAPDDGWVIAVFSVPESERQHRHQLRSRLAWLGFGTVSSGVWIAPAHALDDTRDHLLRHGLDQYVNLFRGDYVAFGDPAEQVSRWWDLEALKGLYDDFVAKFAPMATRLAEAEKNTTSARDAFVDYVRVLTAWRRFPYLDPGLPDSLLPATWSGTTAADLFFELRRALEEPAHEFARGLLAGS